MALLLASLVWVAIPPAKPVALVTVAVGVLSQALMRTVLFRLYQRTEVLIKSANHPILHMPLNDMTSSLGALAAASHRLTQLARALTQLTHNAFSNQQPPAWALG